jgi:hypothetical protein
MSTRKKASLWWMALPFVVILVLMLALTLPNGLSADAYSLARVAGLLGYLLIFVAVLSSAFVRPLIKTFGRPFVLLHHIVAYSGLGIIFLHPILIAMAYGDLAIVLPRFDSLGNFFRYGGSPAFDLLLLAVLAALLRRRFKSAWQIVHALTYVAFVLGTVHATTIGAADVQAAIVKWIAWLLALGATAIFALRRTVLRPKRPARRARPTA